MLHKCKKAKTVSELKMPLHKTVNTFENNNNHVTRMF